MSAAAAIAWAMGGFIWENRASAILVTAFLKILNLKIIKLIKKVILYLPKKEYLKT